MVALRAPQMALPLYPEEDERPRTRADCEDGPRPCPWISCRHHLLSEVGEEGCLRLSKAAGGGTLSLYPSRTTSTAEELAERLASYEGPTCVLDEVEAHGAQSSEQVGQKMGFSRQRVNQIERPGRLRARMRDPRG